jgi:hypothetical protein
MIEQFIQERKYLKGVSPKTLICTVAHSKHLKGHLI